MTDGMKDVVVAVRALRDAVAALPLAVGTGRAVNATRACERCGNAVKPPRTDRNSADLEGENPEHIPMCFTCKTRPCEGWSAYCHECQCKGAPTL